MRFAPYLVATIYSKRPPCLNFAVYIASIRNYMLPRRLRRLDALLAGPRPQMACHSVLTTSLLPPVVEFQMTFTGPIGACTRQLLVTYVHRQLHQSLIPTHPQHRSLQARLGMGSLA